MIGLVLTGGGGFRPCFNTSVGLSDFGVLLILATHFFGLGGTGGGVGLFAVEGGGVLPSPAGNGLPILLYGGGVGSFLDI
ncbi:hypothetical protein PEC730217_36830 [Pectobacterium carotovorum subsp. carotovorum]|nr:hypothetical protein PEC730217_36830 [Pectobacterium carotovorum subsp. carotovorum]